MTLIVSNVSVAQAATIINAILAFIQFTFPASVVILMVYFMPKTNSALSWSSISRTIHSSLWPVFLRSESSKTTSAGATVFAFTSLTTFGALLIAIAGIVLPLGLRQGPLLPTSPQALPAEYMPDTSAIGLATTPNRGNFQYGRVCGFSSSKPCPGDLSDTNATVYSQTTVDIFNSTPHGPFSVQYRLFFTSDTFDRSSGILGTVHSNLLRDDIFTIEGLVVDMSATHPGIGFWNMSMPSLPSGGTWSEDILWLEPATACVDTNLTVEYVISFGLNSAANVASFNIIDHGGFYDLTQDYPQSNRDGQRVDLEQRAYKGAILSNRFAMLFLNTSRESSYEGRNYTLETHITTTLNIQVGLGQTTYTPLGYFNETDDRVAATVCRGFGPADTANLTNTEVFCGIFLAPPVRNDGGDPKVFDMGSRWSQRLHACASTTRASIQTTTFSTLNTSSIGDLRITRRPSDQPVLWAMEKTDLMIADINLMWGRVNDKYEGDSSLWTTRSEELYLPAGSAGILAPILLPGEPFTMPSAAWVTVYQTTRAEALTDYAGVSDYAVKAKLQSLIDQDPVRGHANIRNIIWTDIMSNAVLGTTTKSNLMVTPNHPSIEYDFRFAIPGFILLALWLPSIVTALALVITRMLELRYVKQVLDHTSVGRVVTGSSLLGPEGHEPTSGDMFTIPESFVVGLAGHPTEWSNKARQHQPLLDGMSMDRDIPGKT
ncbi:hypothetical protein AGABI2DRAFT_120061 [Agaricus bisporus var. bisporus H97]|uniref:hypothetical protein n=1 Tax=Agaricus bisporus var. bisporus (strain H97 / ATCC MYA-4626 / FGSC 10389) TaxID=936046 RepID=UPI00029F6065|nr:hypothetical protein AGABI2DRAFT_120061 [Agaricus bisporus var. bisporus H97]EKV45091.1 hypothetical protein AGABI2DRAFT_120061 [Agaricus bisporus var. bisporus H97]